MSDTDDYVLSQPTEQRWFPDSKECINCREAISQTYKYGSLRWVHCRTTQLHCALESPVATPHRTGEKAAVERPTTITVTLPMPCRPGVIEGCQWTEMHHLDEVGHHWCPTGFWTCEQHDTTVAVNGLCFLWNEAPSTSFAETLIETQRNREGSHTAPDNTR